MNRLRKHGCMVPFGVRRKRTPASIPSASNQCASRSRSELASGLPPLRTYWLPANSSGIVPSKRQSVRGHSVVTGAKLPERYGWTYSFLEVLLRESTGRREIAELPGRDGPASANSSSFDRGIVKEDGGYAWSSAGGGGEGIEMTGAQCWLEGSPCNEAECCLRLLEPFTIRANAYRGC